jgi:hypothetical protein
MIAFLKLNSKMFSIKEKEALDKISKISDIESRLNDLLSEVKANLLNSKEIFNDFVKNSKRDLEEREVELRNKTSFLDERLKENYDAIDKLYKEKSEGFPWLATAYVDYSHFNDMKIKDWLMDKSHPALTAAEALTQIACEKREAEKKFRITKYLIEMYESLFPWLTEYVGEDLNDILLSFAKEKEEEGEQLDPVLHFVPKVEYETLSEESRNQKALDRYLNSRGKKPWQIGRDYERYIGYLYEQQGYKVYYEGIVKGLEDLGRDLICIKGDEIEIVQCKCWANYKTIHEKHINQLYGTAVKYYIEHKQIIDKKKELTLFPDLISSGKIKAAFITSTKLSDTAIKFAEALGIIIVQEKPLQKYPIIKCNVGVNGEKIYHLPFDQQYDNTQVINEDEFYAETIKEAMSKGFRRAFRWKGNRE